MSFEIYRQSSGFSVTDFSIFRAVMDEELRKEKNHVGLQGPGARLTTRTGRRQAWGRWLDSFIDGPTINRFWGPGTKRRWCLKADRVEIKTFVGEVVKYFSVQVRKQLRREDSSMDRDLPVKCRNTRSQTVSKPSKYKRSPPAIPCQQNLVGKPQPRFTRSQPFMVLIETIKTRSPPKRQCRNDPAVDNPKSTSAPYDLRSDFVLGTSISGSSEVKLIYGVDVPSLYHLIEGVHKRHGMGPDQEVVEITMTVGGRTFNVDLEECRDWKHIVRRIIEGGSRAQVVVKIC